MTQTQSKSIFSQYAMKYWEKGFNVIPVEDKRAVPGAYWKHLQEGRQTISNVEELVRLCDTRHNRPEVGIAIVMNDSIGAIDIDADNTKLMQMAERLSPHIKRGKKGVTAFVRHDGLPSYRSSLAIEFLARKTICVIPPSYHSENDDGTSRYYYWCGKAQNGLLEIEDISELPELTEDGWEEFIEYCTQNHVVRPEIKRSGMGERDHGGAGRNITLFNAVSRWLENEALDREIADDALMDCAKYISELDHKLYPGNEYFKTDGDNEQYRTVTEAAYAFSERAWKNMEKRTIQGHGAKVVVENLKTRRELNAEAEDDAVDFFSDVKKIVPTTDEWEAVIPRGGIIEYQYNRYLDVATNPVPQFGLTAALATISFALSNMVSSRITHFDKFSGRNKTYITWPNHYFACIGPSCAGKDAVKIAVTNALLESDVGRGSMTSEVKSGSAMFQKVYTSPKRSAVFNMDEVFKIMNSPGSGGIIDEMLQLYTAGKTLYAGGEARTTAYKKEAIFNPAPIILGMSTPSGLRALVNKKFNEMGLLNRFFFCYYEPPEEAPTIFDQLAAVSEEDFDRAAILDGNNRFSMVKNLHEALESMMDSPVEIDPDFSGDVGKDGKSAPLKTNVITAENAAALNAFGSAGLMFGKPAMVLKHLAELQGAVVTELDEDSAQLQEMVEALTNLVARSSESINTYSMWSCMSDQRLDRGQSADDFIWGAKINELSIRSFIGSMGDMISFGGKAAGLDSGVEYLRKRIIPETGDFKCKRITAERAFRKMYPDNSIVVLKKCMELVGPTNNGDLRSFKGT